MNELIAECTGPTPMHAERAIHRVVCRRGAKFALMWRETAGRWCGRVFASAEQRSACEARIPQRVKDVGHVAPLTYP